MGVLLVISEPTRAGASWLRILKASVHSSLSMNVLQRKVSTASSPITNYEERERERERERE